MYWLGGRFIIRWWSISVVVEMSVVVRTHLWGEFGSRGSVLLGVAGLEWLVVCLSVGGGVEVEGVGMVRDLADVVILLLVCSYVRNHVGYAFGAGVGREEWCS
jgi:hypothetical protein